MSWSCGLFRVCCDGRGWRPYFLRDAITGTLVMDENDPWAIKRFATKAAAEAWTKGET